MDHYSLTISGRFVIIKTSLQVIMPLESISAGEELPQEPEDRREDVLRSTASMLNSLAAEIPPDLSEQMRNLIRSLAMSDDPVERARVAKGWWYLWMHGEPADMALFMRLTKDESTSVRTALATNESIAWANPELLSPLAEDSSADVRRTLARNSLLLMNNAAVGRSLLKDSDKSVHSGIDPELKRYLKSKYSID
jgi:hypothetical protein